jgi:hypothetical protein
MNDMNEGIGFDANSKNPIRLDEPDVDFGPDRELAELDIPAAETEAGPTPTELAENEELRWMHRAIDAGDRPWMEALGCKWPDKDKEAEWLTTVEALCKVGSERRPYNVHDTDEHAARELYRGRILEARFALLRLLPREYKKGEQLRALMPDKNPIPSRGFIANMRFMHSRGVDVAKLPMAHSIITGKAAYDRQANLKRQGIDVATLIATAAQRGTIAWEAITESNANRKIQIMRGIANTWNWESGQDVNRIIERVPGILGVPQYKLLVLGRIASEAHQSHNAEEVPDSVVLSYAINSLEASLVVYLERESNVISPVRMTSKARGLLKDYSTAMLRSHIIAYARESMEGYVVAKLDRYLEDNPDIDKDSAIITLNRQAYRNLDPAVRTYLRYYPATEAETKVATRLREPASRGYSTAMTEDFKKPDAYQTFQRAETTRQYIDYLRRMGRDPTEAELDAGLGAIAAGIAVETRNPGKHPSELSPDDRVVYNASRDARRLLATAFASRLFDRARLSDDEGSLLVAQPETEGALENGVLKLMIAILALSEFTSDQRPEPEHVWSYLKKRMRAIKLDKYFDDEEPAPES